FGGTTGGNANTQAPVYDGGGIGEFVRCSGMSAAAITDSLAAGYVDGLTPTVAMTVSTRGVRDRSGTRHDHTFLRSLRFYAAPASKTHTDWTLVSGNVYKRSYALDPLGVWFNDVYGDADDAPASGSKYDRPYRRPWVTAVRKDHASGAGATEGQITALVQATAGSFGYIGAGLTGVVYVQHPDGGNPNTGGIAGGGRVELPGHSEDGILIDGVKVR